MNTVTRLFVSIAALTGLVYAGLGPYGWRLGAVGFSWDRDRQAVQERTIQFLTDLRFKDFTHAGTYHSASDQAAVNLPALIESKFLIKPEQLDIQEVRIDRIDLDEDGRRAKVLTTCHTRVLNANEIKD